MEHYEVIIVGAGIYGSACAYFLSRQSLRVALVEQGSAGQQGASRYSKGIVRVYDPDPLLAQLSFFGREEFLLWEKGGYPGPSPYTRSGCLYRVSEANTPEASGCIQDMSAMGYTPELPSGRARHRRFPELITDDRHMMIWEQQSGYGHPPLAMKNLLDGFICNGGKVFENSPVKGMERRSKDWCMVLTGKKITADLILVTTGAYTRQLLPQLAIFTRSISLLLLAQQGNTAINYPIVDEVCQTYTRPEIGGRMYCGTTIYEDAGSPEVLKPYSDLEREDALARVRLLIKPGFIGRPLEGIKAFDCYTHNKRPIVQFVQDMPGVFIATGFSGRGFKFHLPVAKAITWKLCDFLGKEAQIENFEPSLCTLIDKLAR